MVDSGKIEQEIINKCQQLRIMFPEEVAFYRYTAVRLYNVALYHLPIIICKCFSDVQLL